MDFRFTEEQLMIQAAAREFAQKEIAPVAAKYDASGEFPSPTIAKAGELGFMGIEVPEQYGGAGLDPLSFVLVMEEIAAADAAHSTIVSVNNSLYCNGILQFGTERQRREFLTPVASGKEVGCYGLTEPQSGSDAAGMRARAVLSKDGTHYLINGKKSWITSGPVARYMVLFATINPDRKAKGISAFLIDTKQKGYVRGKTEPKLGIRASATCEVEFVDYRCPVENRLGDEGQGFLIAMTILDAGRVGIAAQATGISRAAYEAALQYARERQAFGAPIGSFPDDPVQARGHEMPARGVAPADLSGGVEQTRSREIRSAQYPRGQHRQAVRLGVGDVHHSRSVADSRRHGLQQGDAARALFPRCQDHGNLRGHQRDPAARDCAPGDRAALEHPGTVRVRLPPHLRGRHCRSRAAPAASVSSRLAKQNRTTVSFGGC